MTILSSLRSAFQSSSIEDISARWNPYNLRRPAARIVQRTEQLLEHASPDQPLVLLLGECHNQPSHIMLEQLVIKYLRDRGHDFTVAQEYPHTHQMTGDLLHSKHPRFAQTSLENFLLSMNISAIYNDAVRDARHRLIFDDAITKITAQVLNIVTDENVHATLPDGMAIRNKVMADLGMEALRSNKHRLLVQLTGQQHVFGDISNDTSYSTSLDSLYSKQGAITLPVLMGTNNGKRNQETIIRELPEEAIAALKRSLLFEGPHYTENMDTANFINALHLHSGKDLIFCDYDGSPYIHKEVGGTLQKFHDKFHSNANGTSPSPTTSKITASHLR